jgi:hypothetical protein
LPLLNSGKIALLDHPRLIAQLCGLERRTARSGKDSIDHAPGAHDDIANGVAGALVRVEASSRAPKLVISSVPMNNHVSDYSAFPPQPYQPQGVVNPHGAKDEFTLYWKQRLGLW